MSKCPHLLAKLQKNEHSCEALLQKYRKIGEQLKNVYQSENAPKCSRCSMSLPFVWSCMESDCEFLGCGRNQNKHALEHFEENRTHCLAINLTTRQIWCYICNNEIPTIPSEDERQDTETDANTSVTKFLHQIFELLSPPLPEVASDFEISESEYKFTPGLCGLSNLGNTCYLNATLQALSNCPPLVHYFLKCRECYEHKKERLLHDIAKLFDVLWSGTHPFVAPSNVVRDIFTINPLFRGYGQQDSQECLRCILDALHEILKEETFPNSNNNNKTNNEERKTENDASDCKLLSSSNSVKKSECAAVASIDKDNHLPSDKFDDSTERKNSKRPKEKVKYESIISDIFEGILLSRVCCKKCGRISDTLDPFYDLSLSLPYTRELRQKIAQRQEGLKMENIIQVNEGLLTRLGSFIGLTSRTVSLLDCLHGFCAEDELTGNDKYKCDYCKTHNEATKTFTIVKLPEILCLHIKRFRHDAYFNSKLSDNVNFPLRGLDIAPFCVTPSKQQSKPVNNDQKMISFNSSHNTIYDLIAVVNHRGSITGGHYVCYAFNKLTRRWYEFDDTSVREVSENEVSQVEAYLLFYQRRTPETRIDERDKIEKLIITGLQVGKDPIHLVSKEWMEKWRSFSEPGLMSTRGLLCRHRKIRDDVADSLYRRVESIPESAFRLLVSKYGRRNQNNETEFDDCEIRPQLEKCSICQEKLALVRRRKEEKERIKALDRQTLEEGEYWYLISCEWLSQWLNFIKNDLVDPPGPISNDHLLKADGTPKEGLRRGVDFRGVTPQVWQYFHSIYGGGPPIIRRTINIYDEPIVLLANNDEKFKN